ncbi:hypothetical protein BC830DRAFT_422407 [Chytriomyces sp. MP71]|nr:hypothetical protein BC830DRAFT_422407 [Chytriomyces sp. MP71]
MSNQVLYAGGQWARLLSNVTINPIFYGNVRFANEIIEYYGNVTKTPWFAVLAQYGTTSGQLGNPLFLPATQTKLDNLLDIQPLLLQLIASKQISPDDTSYYALHVAPNITVTNQSGTGCVNWCGFHSAHWIQGWSRTENWYPLVYGVVPDQGGGCNSCNVFGTAAHELAEVVTDPVPYTGWSTSAATGNLEVSDICNGQYGTVVTSNGITLTVQRIWSNQERKCVLSPSAATTSNPSSHPAASNPVSSILFGASIGVANSTRTISTTPKTSTTRTTITKTTTAKVAATSVQAKAPSKQPAPKKSVTSSSLYSTPKVSTSTSTSNRTVRNLAGVSHSTSTVKHIIPEPDLLSLPASSLLSNNGTASTQTVFSAGKDAVSTSAPMSKTSQAKASACIFTLFSLFLYFVFVGCL